MILLFQERHLDFGVDLQVLQQTKRKTETENGQIHMK